LAATLLLILAYSAIRFKPQFAFGAVLAILHDALIMVAFVVWSRMEFNTTTIAAILTILGYSINDTIVIFDRIRETRRIYPDDTFVNTLDRALTETLGRTIITTATTMLAVLSLFIFTTGSMKDFALALLVGMTSGVYSTIFIASGFVNLWDIQAKKRAKKKLVNAPAVVKA
jgi:preprotein translocase subunit SecF